MDWHRKPSLVIQQEGKVTFCWTEEGVNKLFEELIEGIPDVYAGQLQDLLKERLRVKWLSKH